MTKKYGLNYLSKKFYEEYDMKKFPEATIDNKEYIELNSRYYFILRQFERYVQGYKKFVENNTDAFQRKKYQFSTLKYFHTELKLETTPQSHEFLDNQNQLHQ